MAAPADSDQTDFDLLVLGDVNPDLVLTGKDLIPAFGQVEQLLDSAALTIGGRARSSPAGRPGWVCVRRSSAWSAMTCSVAS